jgi:peptidoglycan/xylan/chitin deacetylase (PgdA/CDA1 family)
MADRIPHARRRTAGRRPGSPRSGGGARGRPASAYVTVVVALALVASLAAAWFLVRARRPAVATGTSVTRAASTTTGSTRPATTPPVEPTVPPEPSRPPTGAAPDIGAIVKAAEVRYPDPPAVKLESISSVRTDRKLVAITLDDGAGFDTRLLDLFEQRGLRCTTFLLGDFAARNPELLRRLSADGFEIANHSWDHPTLTKLSDASIRDQLSRAQQAISSVTGSQVPYMRPPGGGTNSRVRSVAASMGYRVVLWDRSFADTSRYATPERLYHNVMDGLKPGDIILCHWGGKGTYGAMRLILPEMERRGFTPVPLSVLLKYRTAGPDARQTPAPGY